MSVTTRTNRATNPAAASTTGWGVVAGTGGTANLSNQTGTAAYGSTFNRVAWTAATTAVSGGITYLCTGLTAGTTYTLSMWVRSSVAQTLQLTAQFQTSGSAAVNSVSGPALAVLAGTWTQLVVAGVPGNTAVQALMSIQATTGGTNWANGNTLDGDAVFVEVAPVLATNYSNNPSFEVDASGWTAVGGTLARQTGSAPAWVTGSSWGRMTSAAGGTAPGIVPNAVTDQRVSVAPGAWAAVSVAVGNGAGYTSKVGLRFYDASNTKLSEVQTAAVNNTGARVQIAGQAPAGTSYASPVFYLYNGGATIPAGIALDVDAVMLSASSTQAGALSNVTGYFDGGTTPPAGTLYGWSGPAGTSTSVQVAAQGPYFDGSFSTGAGVMYGWTSAANASTSTQTTYVPVITLTAANDAPCPRVVITVQDLSPTDNICNLWLTADGVRTAVRGARNVTINAAIAFTDFEVPLGRQVSYGLEVLSGVMFGQTMPSASATVQSPVDSANEPTWWIQDPLVPGSAISLSVTKGDSSRPYLTAAAVKSLERAADVSIIPIMGSALPVAIGGQRLAAANVDFSTFTNAAQVATTLRNLLSQTAVLLLRNPGTGSEAGLPGAAYMGTPTAIERPVTVAFGGTLTQWDIKGSQVAPPAASIVVPIWTYGAVAQLWLTYQAAQDANSTRTYLDALKSPNGA